MEERVIFYPLLAKTTDLYQALKKIYKEVIGVCLSSDYKENRIVGYYKNRKTPNEFVSNIKQIDFSKFDILFLSECLIVDDCNQDLDLIIDNIYQCGLKVIYNGSEIKIYEKFRTKGVPICSNKLQSNMTNQMKPTSGVYKKFSSTVPVVFIGGIIDISDGREILFKLNNELNKQGIRSIAITNGEDQVFAGYYSYPEEFMSEQINPVSQILILNNWLTELDFKIKPDIIIVKLPKGIMQISQTIHNDFGIYNDMINKVLSPDYFICTVPVDYINDESLNRLDNYTKSQFGVKHLIYHLSNTFYNHQTDLDIILNKPLYIDENSYLISKYIDNETFFDMLDGFTIERIAKDIVEKFQV